MSEPQEKSEPTVAREAAEADFDRWVDAMGLERKLDPAYLNDEDKASLANKRNTVIGAIMDGALVVRDDGCFVFTPRTGKNLAPIVFEEPSGASLMATDEAKVGNMIGKYFKFLASMGRCTPSRFADMKNRDSSVCLAIAQIFLAD